MTMPTMMNCAHTGSGWCLGCVAEMATENERLQAELAAFRAVPAEGGVVVPRELVVEQIDFLRCQTVRHKVRHRADELQACLVAPQPRVLKEGDVVIPAVVAPSHSQQWLDIHTESSSVSFARFDNGNGVFIQAEGDGLQAALEALAAALTGAEVDG